MTKALPQSDFRAIRIVLEPEDFALGGDEPDPPPSDLIAEKTWHGMMDLPDDVAIRTSDHNGQSLGEVYWLWGRWIEAVGETEDALFVPMLDATDDMHASFFDALHGYYRTAFSALRNVIELMTIGACGALTKTLLYEEWRKGATEFKFGTACDLLSRDPSLAAFHRALRSKGHESLWDARQAGSPGGYAAFLDPGAPAQRGGVLSSFNMIAESLELLPARDGSRPVYSSGQWSAERRRWIFLTSSAASRQKILPLHSEWLDMLILRTMEPAIHGAKPVWFVLDEVASLNTLPQLHTAVTEARKSGNPLVLGFQGRSQIEKRYGKDAERMLSQPATKLFLKTSEPHSAKWVSDAIGEIEVERLKESRRHSLLPGNSQFTMEIANKPLVMASEIAGLEPLHGYVKQENLVVKVRFPYVGAIARQPAFLERGNGVVSVTTKTISDKSAPDSREGVMPKPAKSPAGRQDMFPLHSQRKVANAEPVVWDESEWID